MTNEQFIAEVRRLLTHQGIKKMAFNGMFEKSVRMNMIKLEIAAKNSKDETSLEANALLDLALTTSEANKDG